MDRHSLKFKALTTSVEVSSDSKRVIDDLEGLLGCFHPAGGAMNGPADASFIVGAGKRTDRISLTLNGKPLVETHSYPYLLALLEHEICMEVVRRERKHLLIHAGAAGRGGRGCLFPSEAGSGKTTLIASLVTRGFVCFSDDKAAVDLQTLDLVPFAWPLRIKEGAGSPPVPLDGRLRRGWYGPDPEAYPARYLIPREEWIGRVPLPVSLLLFPLYRPGAKTHMERMSGAQAAMGLARHSFNFLSLGKRGFDTVTEIARRTQAYRLEYSDIKEALEEISRMVA
jgi:hypothetical protein